MARAMDVADEIITLAQEKGHPVSNLKLQKMMYFLNALSLVQSEHPLIDDGQMFEKWDYGPVITLFIVNIQFMAPHLYYLH